MDTLTASSDGIASVVPARGGIRDWQRWAPSAAIAWSLIYAVLGISWAVGWIGFPYPAQVAPDPMQPLLGRFGAGAAWIVVIAAGLPAAGLGVVMLRGARGRVLRPVLIAAGMLLAGTLVLLMTSLSLLVQVGYIPYTIYGIFSGSELSQSLLKSWTQWATIHQFVCLIGGFLWAAATLCYARRSGDACLYCGRRDSPEGWTSPANAARWGRIAVYIALVAPVFYALTRYAWAFGIPLGMTEEYWRTGHEAGTWISGIFLATFILVGALLMLGLVQRWGEVFPRWMVGLAGRRVPIPLAVVPAILAAVLFFVGGIGIWSGLGGMVAGAATLGATGTRLISEIFFQAGPTLLFPVWGIALAVAAFGYYYRRRGPCNVCGRGATG